MIHRALTLGGAFFSIAIIASFVRYVIHSLFHLEYATTSMLTVLFLTVIGVIAGLVTFKGEAQ
jgi:hypothetical protein